MDPVAAIIAQVSQLTGQPAEAILSKSQQPPVVKARQMAMALIYQLTPLSCEQITPAFHRHPTLVYLVRRRVVELLARDTSFASTYRQLLAGRVIRRELEGPDPFPAKRGPCPKARTPRINGGGGDVTTHTHGHLGELKEPAVRTKLRDAEENLAYWTMKKASATRDRDRHDYAARITIWQREVDSIRRRLRELTRTEAIPA